MFKGGGGVLGVVARGEGGMGGVCMTRWTGRISCEARGLGLVWFGLVPRARFREGFALLCFALLCFFFLRIYGGVWDGEKVDGWTDGIAGGVIVRLAATNNGGFCGKFGGPSCWRRSGLGF